MDKKDRPDFLSALCILTFIGSSVAFVAYFLSALFFEQAAKFIIEYSSWHTVEAISPLYFTSFMVLYAVSLTGAIRMWKQHRDGFFMYSFAQLIIIFLPVIWVNGAALSVTNVIFTTVFVAGYVWHWKWLS